jgi:hypothetical protein
MAIQRAVHDTPHETPWPHVTRQFIPSSQLGRCLCILDVPSVSAISLKKAHPRGFQLSTLFSWSVLAYSVGCWIDIIKGPSLLLFGRAVSPPPLFFLVLSFQVFCHFVMKFISATTVALGILLPGSANAGTYRVADSFQGASFFSGFSFFSQADPTHGRV